MKSIRKAAEVLRLMAEPPHEMSVAEVARALRVTPSNASRILAELRDAELMDQDASTRRYRPGPLAMRLAAGFQQTTDVLACIQDSMTTLIGKTTHTAWAGVLDGSDVVVLRMQHGGFPIRMELELGRRLPAHAAAMGKALLALLPDSEIRQRMRGKLQSMTRNTVGSMPALLQDIKAVRERGYAMSDEELFLGIKSVAIAFNPSTARDPVALSLSFPSGAVTREQEQSLTAVLLETGRAVGMKIGDPKWRVTPARLAGVRP